jgi:hypothetical protein
VHPALLLALLLSADPGAPRAAPSAAARPAAPGSAEAAPVLAAVKSFYRWALVHHAEVEAAAPRLRDVPGTTRFTLDRSRLDEFVGRLVASGAFDPSFPAAVRRYYDGHAARFAALSQAEFDELARGGRGPQLEVEDMDLFFCAQEYEYTSAYVDRLRLASLRVTGDRAEAEVVSPHAWRTRFTLVRAGGRWRIAGYCVFEAQPAR